MTIRGSSGTGPYVVIGGNFAPGTTAADIQSAVEAASGPMLSCNVISPRPTVTAEMVFAERLTAESVVANFHNQRVGLCGFVHVYVAERLTQFQG